jgi:hypothetical protein
LTTDAVVDVPTMVPEIVALPVVGDDDVGADESVVGAVGADPLLPHATALTSMPTHSQVRNDRCCRNACIFLLR